jgi:hypothetical protein
MKKFLGILLIFIKEIFKATQGMSLCYAWQA